MVKLKGLRLAQCCNEMAARDEEGVTMKIEKDGMTMLVDGKEADKCPYCGKPFRCVD